MKIKKFKDFKKKGKTKIRKIKDTVYNWVPAYNTSSPAPGVSVNIKTINLD